MHGAAAATAASASTSTTVSARRAICNECLLTTKRGGLTTRFEALSGLGNREQQTLGLLSRVGVMRHSQSESVGRRGAVALAEEARDLEYMLLVAYTCALITKLITETPAWQLEPAWRVCDSSRPANKYGAIEIPTVAPQQARLRTVNTKATRCLPHTLTTAVNLLETAVTCLSLRNTTQLPHCTQLQLGPSVERDTEESRTSVSHSQPKESFQERV
jgi:hypothetical protein